MLALSTNAAVQRSHYVVTKSNKWFFGIQKTTLPNFKDALLIKSYSVILADVGSTVTHADPVALAALGTNSIFTSLKNRTCLMTVSET